MTKQDLIDLLIINDAADDIADSIVSALMSCRPSDLSTCHGAALVPVTGAEAPASCS